MPWTKQLWYDFCYVCWCHVLYDVTVHKNKIFLLAIFMQFLIPLVKIL
jgi:hypothetical protein